MLLAVSWPAALAVRVDLARGCGGAPLLVARRRSSRAAVAPVLLWFLGTPAEALLFAVLRVLTVIMHRDNIARLLQGTEGKIGQKASPSPEGG